MWSSRMLMICTALAAAAAGVLALCMGDEVEGVRAPAALTAACGVALLASLAGRVFQEGGAEWTPPAPPTLPSWRRRAAQIALVAGGVMMIALGAAQGMSGKVYHSGKGRVIDAPRRAWIVGGCLLCVGRAMSLAGLAEATRRRT